jgi:rRNA maturation protein Nop10
MPVYERERNIHDYTFSNAFVEIGNINDWITPTKQSKETVHEQYRDKQKKVYQINVTQTIN